MQIFAVAAQHNVTCDIRVNPLSFLCAAKRIENTSPLDLTWCVASSLPSPHNTKLSHLATFTSLRHQHIVLQGLALPLCLLNPGSYRIRCKLTPNLESIVKMPLNAALERALNSMTPDQIATLVEHAKQPRQSKKLTKVVAHVKRKSKRDAEGTTIAKAKRPLNSWIAFRGKLLPL